MRSYEKACENKARYSTRKQARKARSRISTDQLSIYRCEYCGYYHLGHLPRAVRNGTQDRDAWKEQAI